MPVFGIRVGGKKGKLGATCQGPRCSEPRDDLMQECGMIDGKDDRSGMTGLFS